MKYDKDNAVVNAMADRKALAWKNPKSRSFSAVLQNSELSIKDILDAEARLKRFAPFIMEAFPNTLPSRGIIESPLQDIERMKNAVNPKLMGRLLLKRDDMLAVAGSVKARGGVYEVLKHAEEIALAEGLITGTENDYSVFVGREFKEVFGTHAVHVGSTGNLGLSIGIISAKLGFKVTVHMSSDAKTWKKLLLRSYGVTVKEYDSDYSEAVNRGRALAMEDQNAYFVDDENSKNLFLGYAVAALRLKTQLEYMQVRADVAHPIYVYIPCGVGGAPGGICFGLKCVFGDNVKVFFAEPVESPCMLLGLATGLHNGIAVQEIGLSGRTVADGLAVGRASAFVGKTIESLVDGEFTLHENTFDAYMKLLYAREGIFIEPSATAGFIGIERIDEIFPNSAANANITHIVWSTGGSLVPNEEKVKYLEEVVR